MEQISPTAAETRSASELLDWGRRTTEPALRDAVSELSAFIEQMVGYHLGWWDQNGRPGDAVQGKALRPTLVLLSATAMGGEVSDATPAAAAVELVHNFSLLHDDVIDGDLIRHHRPTAWAVFGTDRAIVAGDAMLALAVRTVLRGPSAASAAKRLSSCVVSLCDGQAKDVAFERRPDVSLGECLAMAADKTAALLACSCGLGALSAGARPAQVDAMRAFGHELGMAFQLVDDLLGIWGDPAVTGKPAGADLARRKKSLPVVAALTSDTAAGRELSSVYDGDGPLNTDQIARAADLVEAAGGRAWAARQAADRLADAAAYLHAAECAPAAHADLLTLARLITRRDR
ncbi:polyprenyl synthetase family protein [Saccharopolyspora sp. 5N708]|uniref:polyprenyl synthetase family protein n=1 Tax=Saccharopolyspora sp. 5N708 TaxID=3457424 RepID=UPI003FD69936